MATTYPQTETRCGSSYSITNPNCIRSINGGSNRLRLRNALVLFRRNPCRSESVSSPPSGNCTTVLVKSLPSRGTNQN